MLLISTSWNADRIDPVDWRYQCLMAESSSALSNKYISYFRTLLSCSHISGNHTITLIFAKNRYPGNICFISGVRRKSADPEMPSVP